MIYSSSEDAIADQSPVGSVNWGEGFKFISYSDIVDNNGDSKPEAFYLRGGGWVSSRDVQTRWGSTPKFQGLEITDTPEYSFGWVIPINATIESKRTPSYKTQDLTGRIYDAYQVIPIYNVVNAEGTDWFMLSVADERGARRALETAFRADAYDRITYNLLQMLDALDGFESIEAGPVTVRLDPDEAPALRHYAVPMVTDAMAQ